MERNERNGAGMQPEKVRALRRKVATTAVIMVVGLAALATFNVLQGRDVFQVVLISILAGGVGGTGLALGYYFRVRPNITANRVAYIGLFACWEGLALFFGLSILLVNTGILQRTLEVELSIIAASLVIGGATGDWVGRRRGYRMPNSV